jgi:dTDP-glucose 4,6-dehydratase
MKLLVTGGAGFIGSNFVHYILKKYPGYRIINLDKLTYAGNPENLADLEGDPRHEFIHGDICDPDCVGAILAGGVDAVVNFAAESHVDRSILDSSAFVRPNIEGTRNLIDISRANKIGSYI